MIREDHKDAIFFIGGEQEHSPAFSKKTLFVVGYRQVREILATAQQNNIHHIYLGANRSFDVDKGWNEMVEALLDENYYVTLDYPVEYHVQMKQLLSKGVWQSRLFIPMLSVELPHLATSNPNLTVKFDDRNATGEGVWCWNQHEIMDSNKFTSWDEYGDDLIIKRVGDPVTTGLTKILPKSLPPRIRPEREPGYRAPQVEVENPESLTEDQAADLYAGTTNTSSMDNATPDAEPELVARKTVRAAQSKAKKELSE